jgi:pimeloyl-ACP methyl ester carboxylesterase
MKKFLMLLALCVIHYSLFALNPSRKYLILPVQLGLVAEVVKIKVSDGIELHSWIMPQKDIKKPFVIISNSDGGNMSNCLAQANGFFKNGYNIVLYDYRGFGESSDFNLNREMMYYDEFALDLKAVVAFVKKRYETKSIILYGISMGTIISDLVIQKDHSIRGAIFDSFAIDPGLVVKRLFDAKRKTVLLPDGAKQFAFANGKPLDIPVLLFSGLKDNFTKATDYSHFLQINKGIQVDNLGLRPHPVFLCNDQ